MSRLSFAAVVASAVSGIAAEGWSKSAEGDTARSWNLTLGYTSDFWRNVEGGLATGSAFIGNAEMILDVEGSPGGFRSRIHAIYNNGKSFSELVGDTHVVSNIEADRASRLLEAWMEYAPFSDDRSLKVGLYDLNTEFDASEVGGALINSTFGIGLDAAQSGVVGPSIFPYTGLALRGRWRFDERWLLQGVVIDGVPNDLDSPRQFASLRLDADEGELWVGELEHRTERWRTVVGHWRYSAAFDTLDGLTDGTPRAARNNSGTYGFVEGPVWQSGERRLLAMLRVGVAEPRFNRVESTLQAALVLERPWLNREGEHVAFGVAYARNGRPAQRLASADGDALLREETVVELTWRVPVTPRIVLQPDIQYILNPGSAPGLDDALALGLRLELDLTPH